MTEKIKQTLIQVAILSVTFISLYGLSFAGLSFTEKECILLAEKVCASSPHIDSSKLSIEGVSNKLKRKYAFNITLSAQYKGKEALLFFLPIAGKYGIYSAIFLYEPSNGCLFCGLADTTLQQPPHYYGITPINIEVYTKKIQTIIEKEGLLHEK